MGPNRPWRWSTQHVNKLHKLIEGLKVNKARVTPSDIQHSAAYSDLRVLQIGIRAKVIENQGGIPRVIVLGYDGLPIQPVAPPSPDYIPGPEDPQTPPVPQDEDEREPIGMVRIDIQWSWGDDGDDDDRSGDDADEDEDEDDEDEDDEDEEKEEEEKLAPADSTIVAPVDEPVFPPEGTEPAEVERLLAMTTPSLSPPISLSPPSTGERLASMVDAEERRHGIRDVGYDIWDTWVDPTEAVPEIAPMTVREVNTRVTELAELHERDTQDLYALLEDAQDSRFTISQRVDMDPQQATHQELQTHRDHVYAHETHLQAHQIQLQMQQSTLIQTQHQVHETRFQMQHDELVALRETDRRRQDQMVTRLRREMSDMQAELLSLRGQQRRARQPRPKARIPDHQDAFGDADSHI
ncbi:hypothetical protein Tco_0326975 [Tanacetum coccineum]